MTEEAKEQPKTKPKIANKLDSNDFLFYAGLILIGIGAAFAYSLPIALMVVGTALALTGLVNSYVIVWMSK